MIVIVESPSKLVKECERYIQSVRTLQIHIQLVFGDFFPLPLFSNKLRYFDIVGSTWYKSREITEQTKHLKGFISPTDFQADLEIKPFIYSYLSHILFVHARYL